MNNKNLNSTHEGCKTYCIQQTIRSKAIKFSLRNIQFRFSFQWKPQSYLLDYNFLKKSITFGVFHSD
jgi:hypothetical protein